jgi:peptidoglycan/LPS O-acetylase OafA/YrhL
MLERFRFVDALRGLAFLGVIVTHIATWKMPFFLGGWEAQGARGVQLFFIVSAFTLFYSLEERTQRERRPTLNFFIRRFFRIAPLFWIFILVWLSIDGLTTRHTAPDGVTPFDVILTVFFLHGWWPNAINSVVDGDWTIGAEMSFYCLLPFLHRYIRKMKQALWFCLGALVSMHLLSLWVRKMLALHYYSPERYDLADLFTFFWLPEQIPIFGLGIVLYFILRKKLKSPHIPITDGEIQLSRWLMAAALYLFAVCAFGEYWYLPGHFIYGIGFVLLAWSLALNSTAIFVNGFTCYLGKISYSCYLTHFLFLRLVSDYEKRIGMNPLTEVHPRRHFLIKFAIVFPLTIVAASVTYRLIELPGIKLGKKIIDRWEKRAPKMPEYAQGGI